MKSIATLDVVALTLVTTCLEATLAYYFYIEGEYLNKPWNIKVSEDYKPIFRNKH